MLHSVAFSILLGPLDLVLSKERALDRCSRAGGYCNKQITPYLLNRAFLAISMC